MSRVMEHRRPYTAGLVTFFLYLTLSSHAIPVAEIMNEMSGRVPQKHLRNQHPSPDMELASESIGGVIAVDVTLVPALAQPSSGTLLQTEESTEEEMTGVEIVILAVIGSLILGSAGVRYTRYVNAKNHKANMLNLKIDVLEEKFNMCAYVSKLRFQYVGYQFFMESQITDIAEAVVKSRDLSEGESETLRKDLRESLLQLSSCITDSVKLLDSFLATGCDGETLGFRKDNAAQSRLQKEFREAANRADEHKRKLASSLTSFLALVVFTADEGLVDLINVYETISLGVATATNVAARNNKMKSFFMVVLPFLTVHALQLVSAIGAGVFTVVMQAIELYHNVMGYFNDLSEYAHRVKISRFYSHQALLDFSYDFCHLVSSLSAAERIDVPTSIPLILKSIAAYKTEGNEGPKASSAEDLDRVYEAMARDRLSLSGDEAASLTQMASKLCTAEEPTMCLMLYNDAEFRQKYGDPPEWLQFAAKHGPITNLAVSWNEGQADILRNDGYTRVQSDLNANWGGAAAQYLWVRRSVGSTYVSEIVGCYGMDTEDIDGRHCLAQAGYRDCEDDDEECYTSWHKIEANLSLYGSEQPVFLLYKRTMDVREAIHEIGIAVESSKVTDVNFGLTGERDAPPLDGKCEDRPDFCYQRYRRGLLPITSLPARALASTGGIYPRLSGDESIVPFDFNRDPGRFYHRHHGNYVYLFAKKGSPITLSDFKTDKELATLNRQIRGSAEFQVGAVGSIVLDNEPVPFSKFPPGLSRVSGSSVISALYCDPILCDVMIRPRLVKALPSGTYECAKKAGTGTCASLMNDARALLYLVWDGAQLRDRKADRNKGAYVTDLKVIRESSEPEDVVVTHQTLQAQGWIHMESPGDRNILSRSLGFKDAADDEIATIWYKEHQPLVMLKREFNNEVERMSPVESASRVCDRKVAITSRCVFLDDVVDELPFDPPVKSLVPLTAYKASFDFKEGANEFWKQRKAALAVEQKRTELPGKPEGGNSFKAYIIGTDFMRKGRHETYTNLCDENRGQEQVQLPLNWIERTGGRPVINVEVDSEIAGGHKVQPRVTGRSILKSDCRVPMHVIAENEKDIAEIGGKWAEARFIGYTTRVNNERCIWRLFQVKVQKTSRLPFTRAQVCPSED